MHIMFDEYELLELFECEPRVIDRDSEIYVYSSINNYGFKFELYISIYDMNIILTLTYKDFSSPIIDLNIDNVKRIATNSNKLNIYTNESDCPNAIVHFKPSFRIELTGKLIDN